MSKDLLSALFDSQSSDGYATTQCDSTQADSELALKLEDADAIDVCSTDEDVDTTASEGEGDQEDAENTDHKALGAHGISELVPTANAKQDMEQCLRDLLGLDVKQSLHPPAPRIFQRQAEAMCYFYSLVANGRYKAHQLGLFSREFTTTGCRNFLVDTHAGFALSSSPQFRRLGAPGAPGVLQVLPRHLYEVLIENKPCWLYFDLEFSRVENPDLEPAVVVAAFISLLNQFCEHLFGHEIDKTSLYDLDSTNAEKFSKHIIIKKLRDSSTSIGGTLAFQNNAQAGYFVKQFMQFVRKQLEEGNCLAPQLFAAAKPKKEAKHGEVVSVVDESVYTRNRCFRVLFSTKFGKRRPLLPTWSGTPPLQLLESLASFVPEGTPLCRHPMIPSDWDHESMRASRIGRELGAKDSRTRTVSKPNVVDIPISEHSELFRHLIELWDDVRRKNDPATSHVQPTRVQRSFRMGTGDFIVVALANNRFCFKKGASHKSNGIYLVINQRRWVVYQKCHDVADCPDFRSHEFDLPKELRPEGFGPPQDNNLEEDPVSQELLTQIMADPVTPKRVHSGGRCASRSRSSSCKLCRGENLKRRRSLLGESHLESDAEMNLTRRNSTRCED